MDGSLRILRIAADGLLPEEIDERSEIPLHLVKELVDAGLLKAIDTSTLDGDSLMEPKITLAGRAFLKSHEQPIQVASKEVDEPMRRRGIEIDGEALRSQRQLRTLTQAELARAADISMLTVSKAERGAMVDASTIKKLADALGIQVEALHPQKIDEEIQYHSVFISYGGPDEPFAELLYKRLHADGVIAFFFPENAVPGAKLHRTMSDGVREYDRVLLICSSSSLIRPGVLNEIEQVFMREASEGGSDILIPINIDSYIYDDWKPERDDVAKQIRARVVLSFQGAMTLGDEFDARYKRLLAALAIVSGS